MKLITVNFVLMVLSAASSAPNSTTLNLTTNVRDSNHSSTISRAQTPSISAILSTASLSNTTSSSTSTSTATTNSSTDSILRLTSSHQTLNYTSVTSNASIGASNVSAQRQPGEVKSIPTVTSQSLNNVTVKATSPKSVTVPKKNDDASNTTVKSPIMVSKSKTWRNGDVLCKNSSTCGKHGVCAASVLASFEKRVCLCRRTYLSMTFELQCPGKPVQENAPWEAVECTRNAAICGDKARCLGTHWGEAYKSRLFCFCRHTMEPMRTDFTCLPLSRFKEKKPKYTPIDCTRTGISVCGEEAVCLPSPENASMKICVCPQTNEPVGGPGLLCPRTIIAWQDDNQDFTLAPAAWSKHPEKRAPSFWSTLRSRISLPVLLALVFLIPALLSSFMYWRKCSRRRKQIIKAKKSIVIAHNTNPSSDQQKRYASNPQYCETGAGLESTPLLSVHLMRKSMITDLQEIGEGYFGKVYKGQLHTENDDVEKIETVAVKMLKKTTDPVAVEDFMREAEIMSTFRHKNILSLTGFCARDKKNGPWMVFEYMPFGDLTTVLRNSNHPWLNLPGLPNLSPETLLTTAQQIANGMEYLAQQRFVHRDLACRNCLVGSGLVVKIADFGMSRDIYTCDYYRVGGIRLLPVRWMSPESISYGKFTFESDIWAYGVVLWEIFSYGKQPYFGYTNEEVLKFILTGKFLDIPEQCPREVTEIMKACWNPDPKERMSFEEISERFMKFVNDFQKQYLSPIQPEAIDVHAAFEKEATAEKSDGHNYMRLSPLIVSKVPAREHSTGRKEERNILDMTDSELQELKEDGNWKPFPTVGAKQSDHLHPLVSMNYGE